MAEYSGLSSKSYKLPTDPFAGGGEGDIFDVIGEPGYVAKIYKPAERTTERERKLSFMLANKPNILEQYAWPMDVLYENGQFVGYIMPRISGKEKLRNIYVFDKRKGKPWSLYVAIAKNLSAAVYNVHEIHQVIGDLSPENILVNPNDGIVTLVDTDSYHISDSGRTYRCRMGTDEFVAPELQGVHYPSAPLPTFTQETDRFALAVLIFSLLMNGAHPFSCTIIHGSSSKFQPVDNIQHGKCAFFPDSCSENMDIPPYAPDLNSLPDNIQQLFRRAFITGHHTPSLRPSAEEWYYALEQMEKNLKHCSVNPQHIYYGGAKECPWCGVNEKMLRVKEKEPSISQSAFKDSGSTPPKVTATSSLSPSGQAKPYTPSNYRYTPASSASGTQSSKSNVAGWIVGGAFWLGIIVLVVFLIGRSHVSRDNALKEIESYLRQSTAETEDNGSPSTANQINFNSRYCGSLSKSYLKEHDYYAFTLHDPGAVTLQFDTVKQKKDQPYWDIYIRSGIDPNDIIFERSVGGHSTSFRSVPLSLSAGTYYFEVESTVNFSNDNYSFIFEYQAASNMEIEDYDDYSATNDISLNTEYHGVLQDSYPKEEDRYAFTLDEPGEVTVRFNTKMQEYDDSYWDISIAGNAYFLPSTIWQRNISGKTTSFTETLYLDSGEYYFVVQSADRWSTDIYSFSIQSY